ncbi:hypothetical protein CBER1_10078 [Cercospora berteroae]|uniref:Uncharacterized protein n=1 Tax=Cercospora berteroae TaxID=357750 RepID=A0A2S6C6J4_9PEZI|nr:hypothetical protein CBER1_10078 [Cercospora berteroae]
MCAPGVDQTERSPQRWSIHVPELKQELQLSLAPGWEEKYTFSEAFVNKKWQFGAFEKLLRRTYVATKRSDEDEKRCDRVEDVLSQLVSSSTPETKPLAPIERLPAELLNIILDDPDLDKKDKVALGYCSTTTWMFVKTHILADCKRNLISWAGQSLICTGTWLSDLPASIIELSPDYVEEQKDWDARRYRRGTGARYGPCPARMWNYRTSAESVDVEGMDVEEEWMSALETWASLCGEEVGPKVLEANLRQALRYDSGLRNEGSTSFVLRNLTAREKVLLEVSYPDEKRKAAKVVVKGRPDVSLDAGLLTKICWGKSIIRERGHAKGSWAGHRFEIVDVDMPEDEKNFVDVTKDFVKHVDHVLMQDLSKQESHGMESRA